MARVFVYRMAVMNMGTASGMNLPIRVNRFFASRYSPLETWAWMMVGPGAGEGGYQPQGRAEGKCRWVRESRADEPDGDLLVPGCCQKQQSRHNETGQTQSHGDAVEDALFGDAIDRPL